jgi:hypothetical protein
MCQRGIESSAKSHLVEAADDLQPQILIGDEAGLMKQPS